MFKETKSIFLSKTVIGATAMLVVFFVKTTTGLEISEAAVTTVIENVAAVIFYLITIYGRYKADKKVALKS